jgi:3-deoxy-7-phosphoheptulonate synthase
VETITESLRFMENVLGVKAGETDRIDFFTSHEALHLGFEEAQTRQVPHRPGYFDLTAHFPWLGVRTADPDGAHVEFLRGIENPIGVKVGPTTAPEQLLRLLDVLHPHNVPGRLTLIHRFGAAKIEAGLPALIRAVQADGRNVLWICDPMHGNTRGVERLQDAGFRGDPAGTRSCLRPARRIGKPVGRGPRRNDRRECDGMHRGRPGAG